jgi:hypothetical protein
MSLAEHDQMIEAFSTDASNEPFCEWIAAASTSWIRIP